jgi:DNA-binding CsgD family transcriptional regulator
MGWPRTAVRRSAVRADAFEVITADAVDTGAVRVSVRVISDRALEAIQSERTDALAAKARLTDREREILTYLLIGHSLDDIASTLKLSRRTVKFHQGNILQKLGADSRTDLIRLFSF